MTTAGQPEAQEDGEVPFTGMLLAPGKAACASAVSAAQAPCAPPILRLSGSPALFPSAPGHRSWEPQAQSAGTLGDAVLPGRGWSHTQHGAWDGVHVLAALLASRRLQAVGLMRKSTLRAC